MIRMFTFQFWSFGEIWFKQKQLDVSYCPQHTFFLSSFSQLDVRAAQLWALNSSASTTAVSQDIYRTLQIESNRTTEIILTSLLLSIFNLFNSEENMCLLEYLKLFASGALESRFDSGGICDWSVVLHVFRKLLPHSLWGFAEGMFARPDAPGLDRLHLGPHTRYLCRPERSLTRARNRAPRTPQRWAPHAWAPLQPA